MANLPDPISRRDRQRQTRETLIFTARAVFAEDGYHAASLERIAREAGFTKGAVYSNFDDKPALFLAVLDDNMRLAQPDFRDPFDATTSPTSTGTDIVQREGYPASGADGFALATLEFISVAARDERLAPLLHQRLAELILRYTELAQRTRADDETLPVSDVAILLAALDQGSGLLQLAGGVPAGPGTFNAGLRRLIDPARSVAERAAEE